MEKLDDKLGVAVWGLGRIGIPIFEAIQNGEQPLLKVVALGDWDNEYKGLKPLEQVKRLIEKITWPDASGHQPEFTLDINDLNQIVINGNTEEPISVFIGPDPAAYSLTDATFAADCTGVFWSREKAQAFLRAGISHVVNAAPMSEEGIPHYTNGINVVKFNPAEDDVISVASCSSKDFIYVAQALIDKGWDLPGTIFNGIHSATSTQNITKSLDNVVSHSSGASDAVVKVIPQLEGKIEGYVDRVHTTNGSKLFLTLMVEADKYLTQADIIEAMEEGSVRYPEELAVLHAKNPSTNYVRTPKYRKFSSVVATQDIITIPYRREGSPKMTLVQIPAYYNNEIGPANSQVRVMGKMAEKILEVKKHETN